MLFNAFVTSWQGVGRRGKVVPYTAGLNYVFNVNNITKLNTFGTGSEFLYATNPGDRRTGYDKIQTTSTVADIKGEYDIHPLLNIIELDVFLKDSPLNTTFKTYINIDAFSYAWAHHPYPQYSWLKYNLSGGKEKTVLVDMTLDEITALDDPFNAFNVQWFIFCDPLEEIHPTWYIRVP